MCVTRVGRVLSVSDGRASVEFFDGRSAAGVDTSMVGAKPGAFVEVFGNLALSVITASDARRRKSAWREIRAAAAGVAAR